MTTPLPAHYASERKAGVMFTIALIVILLITALLITTVALWLGARWVKAGKATFMRSFCSVILSRFIMLGLFAGSLMLPPLLDPGNEDLKLVTLLELIPSGSVVPLLDH